MPVLILLLACTTKPAPSDDTGSAPCASSAWYADNDDDGFGAGQPTSACSAPAGHVGDDGDCDDADPDVHPGATEVCNGLDDDCDGRTDPDDATDAAACARDADGDGWGTSVTSYVACDCNVGYTHQVEDCDDSDVQVFPGAVETWYDGVDQDCAGDDDNDADGDGHAWVDSGGDDCDDSDSEVHPGAEDLCGSGVDEDCDGERPDCGLFGEMTDVDAWLSVELDLEEDDPQFLGWALAHAGDGDDNGLYELTADLSSDAFPGGRAHVLMEVPGGGTAHPFDMITAVFLPASHDTAAFVGALNGRKTVTGRDLDGDGHEDYLFGSVLEADTSSLPTVHAGRIDLWLGPPAALQTGEDALTIHDPPGDDSWAHAIELLDPPGSEDGWSIAASRYHHQDFIPGRAEVEILSMAHFEGTQATAPTIFAPDAYRPHGDLATGDMNNDGFVDLVMHSARAELDMTDDPGRAWVLYGPLNDDRSLADADVTVDGDYDGDLFAVWTRVTHDEHGQARLIAHGGEAYDWSRLLFYDCSEAGAQSIDDAVAAIDGDGSPIEGLGGHGFADIGDIDLDGVPELAVAGDGKNWESDYLLVFDMPTEGTVLAESAQARIESPAGEVGETLLSGRDYDGDGFPDLVVGAPYWGGDERGTHGRFQVFRGGPDGF